MLFIKVSLSIIGPRFTCVIFTNSKISIFSIHEYLNSVLNSKILFIEALLFIIGLRFICVVFIDNKISISGIYRYLSSVLDLKIPFTAAGYAL